MYYLAILAIECLKTQAIGLKSTILSMDRRFNCDQGYGGFDSRSFVEGWGDGRRFDSARKVSGRQMTRLGAVVKIWAKSQMISATFYREK